MIGFTVPDSYAVPLLSVLATGLLTWAAWTTRTMGRIAEELAHGAERQTASDRLHVELGGQLASVTAQLAVLADRLASQGAQLARVGGFLDGLEHGRAVEAHRERTGNAPPEPSGRW